MITQCPKCRHAPLPADQSFPAACPACGVILAKVGQPRVATAAGTTTLAPFRARRTSPLTACPADADDPPVNPASWRTRLALWAAFALWGLWLIGRDPREGEIGQSFIHLPLLIFHEAGHVLFRPFGEWLTIAGGTLAQWLMPLVMAAALRWKNRDRFGAALCLWLLGVSLMDAAAYMYDALEPQLMLLSGATGEEGGHDWIFLFSSMGLLPKSQHIGITVHRLGAIVVLIGLAWAGWVLWRQRGVDSSTR
jgi:hypothetical protein